MILSQNEQEKIIELLNSNAPYQLRLAPVEIVDLYPSTEKTAQLKLLGVGRDGRDYAIKKVSDSERGLIPASEMFCYRLARRINIAVPSFEVLSINGELAFGSVWEGGVLSDMSKKVDILSQKIVVAGLADTLSRIYALDIFVNNIDRNIGNYLFRESRNRYVLYAFDFGMSWYEAGFDGLHALDSSCKTAMVLELLKQFKLFNPSKAQSTLDEINAIGIDEIAEIINGIPKDWMSKPQKEMIIKWWHSSDFNNRLRKLQQEISRHVLV